MIFNRIILTIIKAVLALCLILSCVNAAAQAKVRLGFYNVENLYDTVPSKLYDDKDFTPSGKYKWDSAAYHTKLKNIARVIDDMNVDIIGLAEVENLTTVKDLVTTLKTDYNFIHRSKNDRSRMDVVLMYKGDKFVPQEVKFVTPKSRGRKWIYVKGELHGRRIDIVVCHLPSKLNSVKYRRAALDDLRRFADSLHTTDRQAKLVIMGDLNTTPYEALFQKAFRVDSLRTGDVRLMYPLDKIAAKGYGSYVYRDRWQLLDNIILSNRLAGGHVKYRDCGVYVKKYMLQQGNAKNKGYPQRTIYKGRAHDGFSDHLPVYVTLFVDK